jgi:hypothetical protein
MPKKSNNKKSDCNKRIDAERATKAGACGDKGCDGEN